MRFSMSTNDSKPTDVSTVAIDQTEITLAKPRISKKFVIGVVVAVLIVCLSLAAILIGVYFSIDGENNLVKEMVQLRDNTQVERQIDLNANIVQYYFKVADYEQWTVDDLNNLIEVAKIKTNDGSVYCFVYPLNGTSRTDMNQVNQPMIANQTSILITYFHVSRAAIPDTSFLSKTASNLCDGISMFWANPACPGTYEDPARRVKRNWWTDYAVPIINACIRWCD